MLVVSDSSPLRYLIVIRKPELLPSLFGKVWIPFAVADELSTRSTPEAVRAVIEQRPPWLAIRNPLGATLMEVDSALDSGERAALALARDLNADLVLVDDAAGRREAKSFHLRITGTLGILRLAAERGLIDVPDVVSKLRQSGFYMQETLILAVFGRWL